MFNKMCQLFLGRDRVLSYCVEGGGLFRSFKGNS